MSKFSRERDQRRALIKGLANSLVLYEKLETTAAKAKTVAPYVERLVKLAKRGTVADRRLLRSRLTSDNAVKKLVEELALAWRERQGGYTRVIKSGNRGGDNAPLAVVSLILPAEIKPATQEETRNKEQDTSKPQDSRPRERVTKSQSSNLKAKGLKSKAKVKPKAKAAAK